MADALICPNCGKLKVPDSIGHKHTGHLCFYCGFSSDKDVLPAPMPDEDKIDRYEEALQRIVQWADAYPLDIFPEPDFKRAHDVLTAAGITLDAIAASCMRRVVGGVGKIARKALANG